MNLGERLARTFGRTKKTRFTWDRDGRFICPLESLLANAEVQRQMTAAQKLSQADKPH